MAAPVLVELDIRSARGQLDVAERLAGERPTLLRNLAGLHAWALAGYHLMRNDTDRVRAIVADGLGDPTTRPFGCLLLGRLVELELDEGNRPAAAGALEALEEMAAGRVIPWALTTLQRARGLVHGDVDALREAAALAGDAGLVVERARAQLALGEVEAAAVDDLLEAHQTFSELGAQALQRRAGRRLRDLGAKVPRRRRRVPGVLTEAEQQIAGLVQQGMRNRDIAAVLHYSPRTVEVYLSRIYSKLRVSSRLELARALDSLETRP